MANTMNVLLAGFGGHGIGLVEQQVATSIVGNRCENGNDADVEQAGDGFGVLVSHLACVAQFAVGQLDAGDQVHVGTCYAQGIHLVALQ